MKGSCLCGAIRYEVDGEPKLVFACHCFDSQKWTGSAFSLNAVFPKDALHLEGVPSRFVTTGDSGRSVMRNFCGACGSSLYTEVEKTPGIVILAAGTLDGGTTLVPKRHAWVKRKHEWVGLNAEAQQFLEEMA